MYIYIHVCVWQAAAEKLIQYARTDEEREKLITEHRDLLNKLLDTDDDLDMDADVDSGACTRAEPSPGGGFSPLPPRLSDVVNKVGLEKNVQ